jgi:hypothetical protein
VRLGPAIQLKLLIFSVSIDNFGGQRLVKVLEAQSNFVAAQSQWMSTLTDSFYAGPGSKLSLLGVRIKTYASLDA